MLIFIFLNSIRLFLFQTTAAKAAANQYAAAGYQANTAASYQAATYAAPAAQTTVTAQPVTQAKQTANSSTTYSGYDAALYSAATMYVAQQSSGGTQPTGKTNNWQVKNYMTYY